jgi:hypothetical protein
MLARHVYLPRSCDDEDDREDGISRLCTTGSEGWTRGSALSEYSLNLPEGLTWLPRFRDIFDEGRDLPPERPAALQVALASGKADVLSGRYVSPVDDLDRLIEEAREIKARKLYSLQVQRL